MKTAPLYAAAVAALTSSATAAKESRTFAVLRFNGDGPLMEGRVDPIVMQNQPVPAGHVHTVMGASNFGFSVSGPQLQQSQCTNAKIKGDFSNYWFPKLYFHDAAANTFEPVPMFYSNVYYFFDKTQDQIKAFPLGLQILTGNASTRVAPALKGDTKLTAPGAQPASWTCPRSNDNIPAWPLDSDGSKAGFQSKNNKGEGTGFPFAECDGYASPLRGDIHLPSCVSNTAALTDYKTNAVYPNDVNGYWNCPQGYTHVPHLFIEVYWNTPLFKSRWTPNQGSQPFVLSNGDRTGFSWHADFVSGWDEKTLQHIIDTCDAGTAGMDRCPGVETYPDNTKCNIQSPVNEVITGTLSKLPGNNPLAGWGVGDVNSGVKVPVQDPVVVGSSSTPPAAASNAPTSSQPPAAAGNGNGGNSPVPPVPTDPPKDAATETEKPSVTSKVITTTGPNGALTTVTVWETVTQWITQTVYEDATATAPAPAPTGQSTTGTGQQVAGWTALGCYKDTDARVIQGEKLPALGPLTNEKCVTYCSGKGYTIAGTENGGQCFCGKAVVGSTKLDAAKCATPCEGDASQVCGGGWALSVFSKDGTLGSKRHLQAHALHQRGNVAYSPRRRR